MKNDSSHSKCNDLKNCTVYFDGACPVCSKEIATYQQWNGAERIEWIDASSCSPQELGGQLERVQALAKLHVRDANGQLTSGAAAFVVLWSHFPALAWLTPLLSKPPMIYCLDHMYRLFLKLRPIWRKPTA
ncbi:DUF393 domain-containing protein [soil metagenome]